MAERSRLMRRVLVLALILGASGAEATDSAWKDCLNPAPDLKIAGCSAVLARGNREKPLDRAKALRGRANAYYAIGDYDRAIDDFTAALRLDPAAIHAYNGRGLAYRRKHDFDHAIADYTAALRHDPNFAHGYFNRASAYAAKGDFDQALADYNRALSVDINYAHAYHARGLVYLRRHDLDLAVADFNSALTLDPLFGRAYVSRANAYKQRGAYDAALADVAAALRLDPQNAFAYQMRGEIQQAKGLGDQAAADFAAAQRLDPTLPQERGDIDLADRGKGGETVLAGDPDPEPVHKPADAGALLPVASPKPVEAKADIVPVLPPPPPVPGMPQIEPSAAPAAQPLPVPVPDARQAALGAPLQPAVPPQPAAPREKRLALVIGNAHYVSVGLLANPQNDAHAVAETLRAAGFAVTEKADLTREQLVDALAAFAAQSATADWAVVYFSGHGIEMGGINYLIPVDAKFATDTAIGFEAVPLNQVMAAVDGAHKLRLIILDACRSNPFASRMHLTGASRAPSRGLVRPPEPDPGELIVYAARDGEVASDGDGKNSPFTQAFIKEIHASPVDVRRLFDLVRDDVIDATGGQQHPFTYGSLPGREDFLFQTKP